jgi:hypothetical protein
MGEHCHDEKCCCPCHQQHEHCHDEEDGHEDLEHFLLEVADAAWMEVLKDKIKEHILSTQKDRMSELAKIVSEGNSHRWKNKMEKKQGCKELQEKLCNFFGQQQNKK